MSMEKIKKFVKDHKTEIICSVLIGASSFALGVAGFKIHKIAITKKNINTKLPSSVQNGIIASNTGF